MKTDCKWFNDIECPYASGFESCSDCAKYEKDTRKHPLEEHDQADYLRDMERDR